jgi:hypothetical protein
MMGRMGKRSRRGNRCKRGKREEEWRGDLCKRRLRVISQLPALVLLAVTTTGVCYMGRARVSWASSRTTPTSTNTPRLHTTQISWTYR